MEEKLLYKIHVTGHVQGVGFRWNAAREARNLDLKGFVRNLSDGSVYIEAEGSLMDLNVFVDWCKKGPGFSSVESVDVVTLPPVNYNDFSIRS
jgi:acylphosphatase